MTYKDENGNEVGYTGGMINFAFLRPLQVALLGASAEKKSKNKDFPDFQIALQKPKGYEGGRQIVGALWHRVSKDGTKNFISGYIESPLLPNFKVYIALFTAGENAKEDMLYDVAWSAPKRDSSSYIPPANDNNDDASYYMDDNETIPF